MSGPLEDWERDGAVVAEGLVPDGLIDAYCRLREPMGAMGWPDCTPYMRHAEVRDLCLDGATVGLVELLVGEPVGLHLNLTNWVSTERTWHQDYYLNPPYVGDGYCGVWVALADVDPGSGPLQYVPGSHRWPALERDDVLARLEPGERTDPDWPRLAERFVTGHWEGEIERRGAEVRTFVGRRGDALLWHPRVVHRGSVPEAPGSERRSIISHYSAVSRRLDMPRTAPWAGGRYFVL